MLRNYIQRNIISSSILLFIVIYLSINYSKPSFLYNTDGSLRHFGLNNSKKTVIPIWLLTIILSLISYLIILYYVSIPKIMY
jgi:hypothetical protein